MVNFAGTSTEHYMESVVEMITNPVFAQAAHHFVLVGSRLRDDEYRKISQETGIPEQRLRDTVQWIKGSLRNSIRG